MEMRTYNVSHDCEVMTTQSSQTSNISDDQQTIPVVVCLGLLEEKLQPLDTMETFFFFFIHTPYVWESWTFSSACPLKT